MQFEHDSSPQYHTTRGDAAPYPACLHLNPPPEDIGTTISSVDVRPLEAFAELLPEALPHIYSCLGGSEQSRSLVTRHGTNGGSLSCMSITVAMMIDPFLEDHVVCLNMSSLLRNIRPSPRRLELGGSPINLSVVEGRMITQIGTPSLGVQAARVIF